MEIHKLNASLNWEGEYESNPWDLRYANVDLAARVYPTSTIQVPLAYIQFNGEKAYSIGFEKIYRLFMSPQIQKQYDQAQQQQQQQLLQYYDYFYDDEDVEELQQEQQDDFQYEWNAFHQGFFQQPSTPSHTPNFQTFFTYSPKYTHLQNTKSTELMEYDPFQVPEEWRQKQKFLSKYTFKGNEQVQLIDRTWSTNSSSWMQHILYQLLDLKIVQGVFKLNWQKPWVEKPIGSIQPKPSKEAGDIEKLMSTKNKILDMYQQLQLLENKRHIPIEQSTWDSWKEKWMSLFPQFSIMNYLSFIFGRNKLSTNVGYQFGSNSFNDNWKRKLALKLLLRRKFFFLKKWFGIQRPLYVTGSVINFHLPERERLFGINTSIRGFSLQCKRLGQRNAVEFSKAGYWSPFSEEQRSTILNKWKEYYKLEEDLQLPPLPIFATPFENLDIHAPIFWQLFRIAKSSLYQFSKVFRYFIDLQISTIEHTVKRFYPFQWQVFKSYILSRVYEQIYLISLGFRSRIGVEYSWKRDEQLQMNKAFRIPFEMNWGCDYFRIWLFLDLASEQTASKWQNKHQATIAATLLDVYTLFTYTLSLHPIYSKILQIYQQIKQFLLSLLLGRSK